MYPFIGNLGAPELLILLAIVVLLFGASKLPDLARGSGRALRIFKAETKGLDSDETATAESDADGYKTPEELELDRKQAELDADREALRRRDDTTA